jgi:hypothetical protein
MNSRAGFALLPRFRSGNTRNRATGKCPEQLPAFFYVAVRREVISKEGLYTVAVALYASAARQGPLCRKICKTGENQVGCRKRVGKETSAAEPLSVFVPEYSVAAVNV